ncbi:hypothetical protein DW886_17280 [Enterocloster aldenensis]|uniref:PcfJ domain-containing protein n=1 Tax=Enterocloster aldenensis TaxID=358742 RepID=UPI000E49D877|nr:hypothetical protein DW886_17280 [Enterocloster aldenensis]
MPVLMNDELIKEQDNVSLIKEYIRKYKDKYDETLFDMDDDGSTPAVPKKEVKKRTAADYFKVVLSSGIDTIIQKQFKKDIYQLVMMPSQDKYLIKKGEAIQTIDNISMENFQDFFKQLKKDDSIKINNIVFGEITKEDISHIYRMITGYRHYLSNGMMSLHLYKTMLYAGTSYYYRDGKDTITSTVYLDLLKNEKLLKYITVKTPILENNRKYDEAFVEAALTIEELAGYDYARYFIESYTKSSLRCIFDTNFYYQYGYYRYSSNRSGSETRLFFSACLDKKYNLNIKRFIDYICFDLYGQGFLSIPTRMYMDYLDMNYAYNGKVINKYPKTLYTDHDIMTKTVETDKEIQKILENERNARMIKIKADMEERENKETFNIFKEQYKEFEQLFNVNDHVVYSYKDMVLLTPESARDLIAEGNNLGHCVATYIKHVATGECLILFVRRSNELESSYLTVEIRKSATGIGRKRFVISQIQGDCKRTVLDEKEKKFFIKFIEDTGITFSNYNLREAAKTA